MVKYDPYETESENSKRLYREALDRSRGNSVQLGVKEVETDQEGDKNFQEGLESGSKKQQQQNPYDQYQKQQKKKQQQEKKKQQQEQQNTNSGESAGGESPYDSGGSGGESPYDSGGGEYSGGEGGGAGGGGGAGEGTVGPGVGEGWTGAEPAGGGSESGGSAAGTAAYVAAIIYGADQVKKNTGGYNEDENGNRSEIPWEEKTSQQKTTDAPGTAGIFPFGQLAEDDTALGKFYKEMARGEEQAFEPISKFISWLGIDI